MKKLYLVLTFIIAFSIAARADFNIWASAVYLNVNGNSFFYNTKMTDPPFAIGPARFGGVLGIFGRNSGTLKITGAEINTARTAGASICAGNFFYTVYKQGERPVSPIFSSFTLDAACTCNGAVFSGCGGRACNGIGDQKFQNVDQSADLTGYDIGNYTLEIYYQASGDDASGGCSQLRNDDNSGSPTNYMANFSITSPLPINFVSINGIDTDNGIVLKWVVQNDLDIEKYEIEKSGNGLLFSLINSTACNQSAATSRYVFTDANPITGTNFYRIKATHLNGSVTLSKVFRVYYGKIGNTIFIFSNPSGSQLSVRFAAINKGNYQMSVLTAEGQKIVNMPVLHDGIDKTIRINLPRTIPKGIYRLFLIDKNQFYKQSFMAR